VRRRYAPLPGQAAIGLAVGAMIDRHKMGQAFRADHHRSQFRLSPQAESLAREARLEGLYVIRTSLPAASMSGADAVRSYKDLALVEQAFRSLKSVDLQIRPMHRWIEPRVRAHVFLCMLAYYVEWHLREAWTPLLFHDHDRKAASRSVPLRSPRRRSGSRQAQNADLAAAMTDYPLTSFGDLLDHLSTLTLNIVAPAEARTHRLCLPPSLPLCRARPSNCSAPHLPCPGGSQHNRQNPRPQQVSLPLISANFGLSPAVGRTTPIASRDRSAGRRR
jgi:hypothetical protein